MSYFDWHFDVWRKIIVIWRNLIVFPYYYFCIPLHLKTLFAPWKRQRAKMKIGFHLDDFVGVVSFNIIARILGALIRSVTIFYGLLFMSVIAVIWAAPVLLWPLTVGLSFPFYLARVPKLEEEKNFRKFMIKLFKKKETLFVGAHLVLDFKKILRENLETAENSDPSKFISHPDKMGLADILQNLAQENPSFKAEIEKKGIKKEDVYQTALWYEKLFENKEPPLLLNLTRIKNIQGIGHKWAYGYTVELDKFSQDLTQKIPVFPVLIHRENELTNLQRILLKTQGNNPLIVGEPGVARHLLAEILAYRIFTGEAHSALIHKRILSLNMHALTSAKSNIMEVKGLTDELLREACTAGNVIICIDEIDKYLSEGEGRIDLSDVVAKFAQSPVGFIGITTPSAYHRYIKSSSSLNVLFEKVEVEPLDNDKTLDVLELSVSPVLEKKYNITVTYPALKKVVKDADRYITSDPFPSKAIELLDEACIWKVSHPDLANRHSGLDPKSKGIPHQACTELVECVRDDKVLTASDIDKFLTEKMRMPLGDIEKNEEEKLVNLENLLHQRIIGQDEAVKVISSALRRGRLDVGNANKPVGTFLFLGPTGVGKTETAKALADVYFASQEKLSRFDMSQYQHAEGLERLIGSIRTNQPGELTAKLADNPFSVLLLDEFEKADKDIFNLFLTLFDEGYISDARGKKVSAKNNIIIATSNAGSEFIRERIQQGLQGETLQKELIEYVQREKIFSPELLNRFDAVVVFTPLNEGQLREVARLMLSDLNRRLTPKEISIDTSGDLIRKIAALGFDPQFGARAMKRAISQNIEDQIAQRLLSGEVKKGEMIQVQL